jgi:heterodisulfide reductase subunit A
MAKEKSTSKDSENPRIGVFVCDCGLNIAAVVDCKEVTEYASTLDDVVVARENKYTCSDSGQEEIKKDIREHKLNRVVVASCSPRLHEPTFRRCVESAGLNRYLFEMANIREHCSWVHEDKEKATEKAKDLVAMAVAKARDLKPLPTIRSPVINKALVIGGGVAGIQSALDLADMGFKTYLVEKEPSIGGHMAMLDKTFPTIDCSICILGPKMSDVGNHENIELLTYSEIDKIEGYIGNFKVRVRKKARYITSECNGCGECWKVCPVIAGNEYDQGLGPRRAVYIPFPQVVPMIATIDKNSCIECGLCESVCEREGAIDLEQKDEFIDLEVGTIIVATGFQDYDANGRYGYGRFDNVITGIEFERLINASGPVQGKFTKKDGSIPKSMAFIQCVGSRDRENPYCSNVCCMYAMKQATQIKEKYPDCEVYIFYMDIRAFGKDYEEFYERLRNKGVKFIRGRPSDVKERDGTLILRVDDTLLDEITEVEVEMLVLSTGLIPCEDAVDMQRKLNISRSGDGFYMEAHPKLRPVDTATDGVFLAGVAQGPKDIPASVAQAKGAASGAAIPLKRGYVEPDSIIALVDPEKCTSCGLCAKYCPYKAIKHEKGRPVEIIEAACKGCGTCAAICPVDAMQQRGFTDEQIMAQIEAALKENPQDKILTFLCNWCSYGGADTAGVSRFKYPENTRAIKLMCSGRVTGKFIDNAFELGAGMVLVSGCHLADCHYISGNYNCKERYDRYAKTLERKGIDPRRLRLEWVSASEGAQFAELMKDLNKTLEQLKKEGVVRK